MNLFKESDYITLGGGESQGDHGLFGLRIQVASSTPLPNMKGDAAFDDPYVKAIWKACGEAERAIENAVRSAQMAVDPEVKKEAAAQKAQLLACFPRGVAVFLEVLPNGYCSNWCCRPLHWYKVTTPVGRIK